MLLNAKWKPDRFAPRFRRFAARLRGHSEVPHRSISCQLLIHGIRGMLGSTGLLFGRRFPRGFFYSFLCSFLCRCHCALQNPASPKRTFGGRCFSRVLPARCLSGGRSLWRQPVSSFLPFPRCSHSCATHPSG